MSYELDVGTDGKPTACRIVQSSGSDLLDKPTCDLIMARARFKPPIAEGKPVAAKYASKATWRMMAGPPDGSMASSMAGSLKTFIQTGYYATIFDYSKDPDHPSCTVVNKGGINGPSCAQAMSEMGPIDNPQTLKKLVEFWSFTAGDEHPYSGEADWGTRESFSAIDLYMPIGSGLPACAVVRLEGMLPTSDPCSHYPEPASSLTADEKAKRPKAHMETSLFAVRSSN